MTNRREFRTTENNNSSDLAPLQPSETSYARRLARLGLVGIASIVTAVAVVPSTVEAVNSVVEAFDDQAYTDSTHPYEVSQGDTLYSIARNENEIENALNIDPRKTMYYIAHLPENVEPLSDGLHESDVLQIPDGVVQ